MKNIKFLALLLISLIGFQSCTDDDTLTYIAQAPGEFAFSNTFLSEYVLIPTASGNLGERFTWSNADFGVETNINYELQKSIIGDFSDMEVFGSTSGNEITLTIGDFLGFANEAGLDNDPATDAPDTGSVYFRLRASVGTNSSTEILTPISMLTLVLPEAAGGDPVCDFDQLWIVGSAATDAGWGWTTPVQLPCSADGVYAGNVYLIPDDLSTTDVEAFRFFTASGDWASGLNYPYYEGEGYEIGSDLGNAMDNDNNFYYTGDTAGVYYISVDTVNKTISLEPQQVTGTCEFDQVWIVGSGTPDAGWGWTTPVQVICSGDGIYSTHVYLIPDDLSTTDVEAFRMFTASGDWASGLNYPYYEGEGYEIDSDLGNAMDNDNNFYYTGDTAGTYILTIDTVAKIITLE